MTAVTGPAGRRAGSDKRALRRRKDDLEIVDQNQFQAQLLDLVQNIVIATDASGHITYWNKFAEQRYGASREDVVGKPLAEAVPFSRNSTPEELTQALQRGQPWTGQIRNERDDGVLTTVMVTVTPIHDADGHVNGTVTVGLDVTERNEMEQSLRETEAQLRALFENAASGLSVTDADGYVMFCNSNMQRITGYSAEELRTMTFAQFTHPDDLAEDAACFQELVAGRRDRYELEKRYIRKDGTIIPVRLVVSVAQAEAGRPIMVIAIVEDITERKRIEQELQHSRDQLERSEQFQRSLAGLSVLANSTLDLDEMLPRICDALTAAFNISAASIFLVDSPNTLELSATTSQGRVGLKVDAAERPFTAGQAFQEGRALCCNHMDSSTLAAPIVLADETIGVLTLVAQKFDRFDASDLCNATQIADAIAGAIRNARLYRGEQQVALELRQMEHSRASFLRVMGHELRTPLGQIIGFGDLLSEESERLSDRGKRYLANIQEAAEGLLPFVQRSLDLVALFQESARLDITRVDLAALTGRALRQADEKARAKQLSVNFECSENEFEIRGDSERLNQVLEILLDNAVKFTTEGGSIDIFLDRRGSQINLSVHDSGCGVADELAFYIFRHGSADDPLTRDQSGMGLSLLTARRIAELHGGNLRLEPSDHGARFLLTLPA